MNLREAFLSAVEDENPKSFLDYIEQHNSKNETFDVTEVLQTLSKKQHERLWEGLKALCNNQIVNATPSADSEDDDAIQDEKTSVMLSCLQGITIVALCSISMDKPFIPSALLETAVVLHGVMMCLPDDSQRLQGSIAQLCETWFLSDLEGKEELITHTLPFLVIRSLAKGTIVDVKHVWGIRQGLLLMDFDDENSESMKQLLQQCMIHPTYLHAEEGHRFLSFLFGIHPDFTKELHRTIKNQIPVCSMGVLSTYGEIYFRAWRVASGEFLEVIEKDCFQDLMYAAVHAQRTGTQSMASRLRKVLGYLHQQKKQQGVDETLVKLYQPIIWRAFKVANPMVRANAAALLIDAFPFQNPDANNEEVDNLLQKQFDILQDLLEDPSPMVRATGVHGVCRIAGVFWELIPVTTLKVLLNKLICEVAFDASSSSVRLAVFQGLKFLLENHLSHLFLKTLLVSLRHLIHDNSEKVRAAFLDLLLLVKGMKAIKFWSIVPLEHLLARLEVETSAPVMRKLVKLLMNSFHPLNKETDIQINRCTALWEANPIAARKFYQYAHLHTSVHATGKFILTLGQCLSHWAKNVGSADNTFMEDTTGTDSNENKENEGVEESTNTVLDLPDVNTIAGILETIAISWAGIKDQLDKKANESIKGKLIEQFTKALPKLLSATEDGRARAALVLISSYLPSNCLPAFSKKCLSTLSSLHDCVSTQDYGPMLDCLCSWGQARDVLDIIHTCLLNKIKGDVGVSRANRAKSCTSKSPDLEVSTALDLLSWLLYQPACREAVLNHDKGLTDIAGILKDVTNLVECHLLDDANSTSRKSNSQDVMLELYPKALKIYCHLHIHLHNKSCSNESLKAAETVTELLVWAERVLLPSLPSYSESDTSGSQTMEKGKRTRTEGDSQDNLSCAKDMLEVIISCSSELLKLGMADNTLCCQVALLTKSLAQLGEKGLPFLPSLVELMYQMSQRIIFLDGSEEERSTDYTQGMLTDILQAIAKNSSAENISQVLLSIKIPLAEVLKTYECKRQAVIAGFEERPQIMACTMAACLAELSQKTLDLKEEPTAADLPTLSSVVLGVLAKSKILLRSFTEELEQCIVSGAIENVELLASATFLLAVIVNANSKLDNLKSCGLQILQQVDKLQGDRDQSRNDHETNPEQVKGLAKQILDRLGVVC